MIYNKGAKELEHIFYQAIWYFQVPSLLWVVVPESALELADTTVVLL